jgi:4-amino-4-deoxy-L-arabinose transferase-like glycosyltransferase
LLIREINNNNSKQYFLFFSFLLLVLRLLWIKTNNLELYADEAQYWVWSQHLDFGYYSKPPFVAWIIALSTSLLGNEEVGVRFFSPILHFITGWIVYLTAKEFDERAAFWAGLVYLTMPAISVSSTIISTDPTINVLGSCILHIC